MAKVRKEGPGVEGGEEGPGTFASAAEAAAHGSMSAAEVVAAAGAFASAAEAAAASRMSAAEAAAALGSMSAAEAAAREEESARERLTRAGEVTAAGVLAPERHAAPRFTSSLIPAGHTPASALLEHPALRTAREMRENSPAQRVLRELEARTPAFRMVRETRALGSPRELRELHALGRHLGMVRSAQRYEAPPPPVVLVDGRLVDALEATVLRRPSAAADAPQVTAPVTAPATRDAARSRAVQRGNELRAMTPDTLLKRLRSFAKRPFASVAFDHGMTAAELHDLEDRAKRSVAAKRAKRKRA